MFKYIKFTAREFLGLNNDYETLLSNQEEILEKLNNLEKLEIEGKQTNYTDYLTLKNLLLVLIFLSFLGGGFWFYNSSFFNNDMLESFKSLGNFCNELHKFNQKGIFDALSRLNENSVNLSKEEIKILLEIKNLLLKKGIDENKSLQRPVNLEGTFVLGNSIPGLDDK